MTRGVEFGASFEIEDRDPVVLVNHDWTFRGKSFLTDHYWARAEYMTGEWTWFRYGKILRENGELRKDGATASVRLNLDEVPGYAQRALLKELEQRAQEAHEQIDLWVQAAKDLLTHVEVTP